MHFAQPIWIIAGIACCALLVFALVSMQRSRRARLERFAGHRLAAGLTRNVSPRLRLAKNCLLVAAVFLLFVALARPQYGYRWVEVKRKGIDILFALDTSRSMLAEDIKPNRLERARLGILDFISRLEGDRVGLMPFAGSPYLMTPLTLDYAAFQSSLNAIDTGIIPHGGTNLAGVIEEAERVLENDANHKILILLTDGENLEGNAVEAARRAKEKGMAIYTVGVGTAAGELIPAREGAGFVKDAEGRYVTSRLDEVTLREIAEATDAVYTPLGTSGQGLEEIYRLKLSLIPKEELMEKRSKVPVERFGWPLAAAIVLLLLEYLLPERKPNQRFSLPSIITSGRRAKKTVLLVLLTGPALLYGSSVRAAADAEAFDAYIAEDFISASEIYGELLTRRPNDPELHYNFGTSAYKNNMYDDAAASFTQALKGAPLPLQEKAYFNRGNACYKKGEETVQANPRATEKEWQQAIDSYESALQLNSTNRQAEENRNFVRKKLEELQRRMEEQQQHNEDQQKQDDAEQEQDGGQDQEQQSSRKQPGEEPQRGEQPQPGDERQPEQGDRQESDTGQQPRDHEQNRAGEAGDTGNADQQASRPRGETPAGNMSQEEAENLLNAMEGEEREINFVPNLPQHSSGRDW